jgi:hypothetical protein
LHVPLSKHRLFGAMLASFLCVAVILMIPVSGCWASTPQQQDAAPATKPQIKAVGISKKPGSTPEILEFDLTIVGEGFGTDKNKIQVVIAPSATIIGQVEVGSVSSDGTILAKFTAPSEYIPRTVTIEAAANGKTVSQGPERSGSSDPFVLPLPESEQDDIRVYRSLIAPKVVSDIFGRRIGKKFIVIQVTVSNKSKDYQYIIHDLSLNLTRIFADGRFGDHYEMSSLDLTLLRGVAEKGQIYDKRNIIIRLLRASGTIAGGIVGVTDFGSSYAPSVAAYNGPVISALSEAFPDNTVTEMNRLNDSAYIANTVIAKEQSKVMAVFLPQEILLDKTQQKLFWDEPTSLWGGTKQTAGKTKAGTQTNTTQASGTSTAGKPTDGLPDLRKIGIYADGKFIVEVGDLVPTLTSANIDPMEMKKFAADNPEVKGYLAGRYLADTSVKLLNQNLPGAAIKLDGTPTDTRLNFIVTSVLPIAPDTSLKIGVVKKDGTHEMDLTISYHPDPPTVTNTDPPAVTQDDKDKPIKITGTNFLPGATVQAGDGITITVPPDGVKNSKEVQANYTVTKDAATGMRDVTVVTSAGVKGTGTAKLEVKAKTAPASTQPAAAPKPAAVPAQPASKTKPVGAPSQPTPKPNPAPKPQG